MKEELERTRQAVDVQQVEHERIVADRQERIEQKLHDQRRLESELPTERANTTRLLQVTGRLLFIGAIGSCRWTCNSHRSSEPVFHNPIHHDSRQEVFRAPALNTIGYSRYTARACLLVNLKVTHYQACG